jgi:hypothetical protein
MKKYALILLLFLTAVCYGSSGQILDSNNNPYYISSIYDSNDLRGLQYVQKNDIMYIAHPDYPVQKLSRFDHANWTIADVNWLWGPFLTQNTTTTKVTPSGKTGSITLTADANIFDINHVGALWKIIEDSNQAATSGSFTADGNSASVFIEGDFTLTLADLHGDDPFGWLGLLSLQKSEDAGTTWTIVYQKLNMRRGEAATVEFAGNESSPGFIYRVTATNITNGGCTYTLTAFNSDIAGYVKITAYTGPNSVTADVVSTLAGTAATTKWAEGAWSEYRGYPRAVCMYQNRLCLAGTKYQPAGFWASASGDHENMFASSLDTGAIVYEVDAAKQNPILWLQDSKGIIAGTLGSTIRIYSTSTTSTLTGNTIGSERQSDAGSCDMQAATIGDSIVYADRNRRKVFDIIYDVSKDGFVTPELTLFAEHITDPCVVEVAVQNRPDPVLWYVAGDGNCLTLEYNRMQGIMAWSKQVTDGNFESVAVIPSSIGGEDEVWFIINRNIDGNNCRYVEKLKPQDWDTDSNNCWFVDSGLTYSGVSTHHITGLSHLEGKTVQIFHDGNQYCDANVADGNVVVRNYENTQDVNVTAATIGLPFTSTLTTLPIEIPIAGGISVGYKKSIPEIVGCFYRSMYGQYGIAAPFVTPTMWDIPFRNWPDQYLGSDQPYTGEIRLPVDAGTEDELRIMFVQTGPFPFNLTAVVIKVVVSEN